MSKPNANQAKERPAPKKRGRKPGVRSPRIIANLAKGGEFIQAEIAQGRSPTTKEVASFAGLNTTYAANLRREFRQKGILPEQRQITGNRAEMVLRINQARNFICDFVRQFGRKPKYTEVIAASDLNVSYVYYLFHDMEEEITLLIAEFKAKSTREIAIKARNRKYLQGPITIAIKDRIKTDIEKGIVPNLTAIASKFGVKKQWVSFLAKHWQDEISLLRTQAAKERRLEKARQKSANPMTTAEAGRIGGRITAKRHGYAPTTANTVSQDDHDTVCKPSMTVTEAGRIGGQRNAAKHGHDHFVKIGQEGGKKGGRTTAKRHGRDFYVEIGKMGGRTGPSLDLAEDNQAD